MTDSIQKIPNKELVMGKKLGEGSFGLVYQGKWQGENVAIKRLKMRALSPEEKREFIQEASAMARLNSPRVIRLYGVCMELGHYAIVMALMPKGDLYKLLSNKERSLGWKKRWQLAIDVGIGLSYLHANKILHRDLKSPNILLDGNLRAKITDFGLSKIKMRSSALYTNKSGGSAPWMAPELFKRRIRLTKKADVYAYGTVLWEISSRKLPFEEALNRDQIGIWIIQGEREDIPKDCPKPYAEVIKCCWKPKPEERPTVAEALESLQNAAPKTDNNQFPTNQPGLLSKITSTIRSWLPFNRNSKEQVVFIRNLEKVKPNLPTKSESSSSSIKIPSSDQKNLTVKTWQRLKTLGEHRAVNALAALANDRLASGSADSTIKIWNISSRQCLKTLEGHNSHVFALTALVNGRLASGSWDKTVKIWDVTSGKCLKTLEGHSSSVNHLALLANDRLASGSPYGTIKIWDISNGKCLKTLEHCYASLTLQALSKGLLASGSPDGTIKIWDISNGQCLKTLEGHSKGVYSLTTLANDYIASASFDKSIKIWDISNGQCLKTLEGHHDVIPALTRLTSGHLASGSWDKTVKIWDVSSGKCLKTLGAYDKISALAPLAKGRLTSVSRKDISIESMIEIWGKL